ncbi:MAG: hypothetical protein OZ913_00705 [Ignavibacteriaceae bacterium]|nr:hypothetical protein [Ignavibacteria bacterium]MCC6885446.1 hypothetical protein [Ignavibacteriales bacterium]MCE7952797.1 hypothetical protein [Chlorobi bacterium CHB7]MDL1887035.1 hypothetical protein [Ignavibacteria bacterium CHB1]MEB2328807.1 hypothetical protein [Ignavibacteriaceae bacterium]RIK49559.1 MAG: hypothetical protein DCC60_02635 [Ignavibacteriota bacterium]
MKFLISIFCFYFLALTALPCVDNNECGYSDRTQSTPVSSDYVNHEQEAEHCSPFCVCVCCGQTWGFTQLQIDLGSYHPIPTGKISLKSISYLLEIPFSIWQPPKIS